MGEMLVNEFDNWQVYFVDKPLDNFSNFRYYIDNRSH